MKKLFAAALTVLVLPVLALILILLPVQALASEISITPYHYIVDKAEILSSEFESEFELRLNDLEHETGSELIVLTIHSLEGLSIEEYAVETFRAWGVGQSNADKGVLLLVALEEHEVHIEVGYGLEGAIRGYNVSGIIDQTFASYFNVEDYEAGIAATINKLSVLIDNEANEETIKPLIVIGTAGLGIFTLLMASLGFLVFWKKRKK